MEITISVSPSLPLTSFMDRAYFSDLILPLVLVDIEVLPSIGLRVVVLSQGFCLTNMLKPTSLMALSLTKLKVRDDSMFTTRMPVNGSQKRCD